MQFLAILLVTILKEPHVLGQAVTANCEEESSIPEVHNIHYTETDKATNTKIFTKWLRDLKDVIELFDKRFGVEIAPKLNSEQLTCNYKERNQRDKCFLNKMRGNKYFIPENITRLLYRESNNDGYTSNGKRATKQYSKWIYNLRDVVILFRDRFGVHIGEA